MTHDVRFTHEAKAIRHGGGIIVKVVRPPLEPSKAEILVRKIKGFLGSSNPDCQPPELSVDDIEADYVLMNTGSVEELRHEAERLVDHFASQELGAFLSAQAQPVEWD